MARKAQQVTARATSGSCKVCGSEGVLRESAQVVVYDGTEETSKHTQQTRSTFPLCC